MKKASLLFVAVIFFLTGCITPAPNNYQAEKTKGINYSNYKTYAWLPSKNDSSYTKMASKKTVESALSAAVIEQLNARGMKRDTVNPDCLFTYTLVLTKTYQVGQTAPPVYAPSSNVGPLPGQYDMYYWTPADPYSYDPALYQGANKVTTFRDGSLVIDMIDRKQNKIVWRTSAQGKVRDKDAQGVRPTINEIVPIMFKKFPISSK
jgi:hypothetical protein